MDGFISYVEWVISDVECVYLRRGCIIYVFDKEVITDAFQVAGSLMNHIRDPF